MQEINTKTAKYLLQLHERDRHFLTKITNNEKFAAARCAMSPDICVYAIFASSGVEAMNVPTSSL